MWPKLPDIDRKSLYLIFGSVLGTILLQKTLRLLRLFRSKGVKPVLARFGTRFFLNFSRFRKELEAEETKAHASIEKHLNENLESPILSLPSSPQSDWFDIMSRRAAKDSKIRDSTHVSGTCYHCGDELSEIAATAMRLYVFSNPLHPDIYPSVRLMECEMVQMTVRLFHGDDKCCGVLTSGGTESLMMAMLCYREWGYEHGISEPEVIGCTTLHAAVDKAAHYFGITLIKLPPDPNTGKLRASDVRRYICSRTVAIFASAPNYPHGVIDPVEDLSSLALRSKVNLHVDACLGSFLIALAEKSGFPVSPFDFRVPGVTSISCDLHKYGFCPKGVSVLMYRSRDLRKHQFFACPTWPGGLYTTPTMTGSRPGVLSAGSWAVMMSLGEAGYTRVFSEILAAAAYIRQACTFPDLQIIGAPELSITAFTSKTLNSFLVADQLGTMGWRVNLVQDPPGFHFCVTYANCRAAKEFVSDLAKAVEIVKALPADQAVGPITAVYGAAAKIPDKELIGTVMKHYADLIFSLK
jgi:sphinganine-1-phosphate aldolase